MLKEKLYNIVHWIGVSPKGLRIDENPEGGLVSDIVVTLALREFRADESLKEIMEKDPDDLFSSNFLVNSLNGKTTAPLDPQQMFRIWMIFTLYLERVVFADKKDPRALILEKVLEFATGVFTGAVVSFIKDNFKEIMGCDECEKKGTCQAINEDGQESNNREKKAWN